MSTESFSKVKIEEFGGRCTQMKPADVPVGMSPDCEDVEFLPGSVRTRGGTAPVLPAAAGAPNINGVDKFLDAKILALGADGQLLLGDLDTPLVPATVLDTMLPNSRMQSVTAYEAQYIALSDGAAGRDLPSQVLWIEDGN